jgi:hypothetical protein
MCWLDSVAGGRPGQVRATGQVAMQPGMGHSLSRRSWLLRSLDNSGSWTLSHTTRSGSGSRPSISISNGSALTRVRLQSSARYRGASVIVPPVQVLVAQGREDAGHGHPAAVGPGGRPDRLQRPLQLLAQAGQRLTGQRRSVVPVGWLPGSGLSCLGGRHR